MDLENIASLADKAIKGLDTALKMINGAGVNEHLQLREGIDASVALLNFANGELPAVVGAHERKIQGLEAIITELGKDKEMLRSEILQLKEDLAARINEATEMQDQPVIIHSPEIEKVEEKRPMQAQPIAAMKKHIPVTKPKSK